MNDAQIEQKIRETLHTLVRVGRSAEVLTRLGNLFLMRDDCERALACFQNALKYDHHYERAQRQYQQVADYLQQQGVHYADRHQMMAVWDEAAEHYAQKVASHSPLIRSTLQQLLGAIANRCDQLKATSLLMICCGVGLELEELHRLRPTIQLTGIDFSQKMLEQAAQRCGTFTALKQADARALPFPDRAFDLVISISGITALDDARAAVQEMRRVARQRIIVSETSLEHFPIDCVDRAVCLRAREMWLHRYEDIFRELGLTIIDMQNYLPLRLTAFELSP